jgi:hypothetical protein
MESEMLPIYQVLKTVQLLRAGARTARPDSKTGLAIYICPASERRRIWRVFKKRFGQALIPSIEQSYFPHSSKAWFNGSLCNERNSIVYLYQVSMAGG